MTIKATQPQRLRILRECKGMKAKEVSEFVCREEGYMRSIEAGRYGATLDVILKLADIYGVTTDQLLGRAPITLTIETDTK
jgi:transcriptional regulator with XRE-family HTH domain